MSKIKQYILIRTDKVFPIGKIMAHLGHNVLEVIMENILYLSSDFIEYTIDIYDKWYLEYDQTKIVLDGGSEENIQKILKKAKQLKIPTSFIEDIHIKERIVAVIGPLVETQAKYIGLDKLKLYK